jgi:hypothetical protein
MANYKDVEKDIQRIKDLVVVLSKNVKLKKFRNEAKINKRLAKIQAELSLVEKLALGG